MKSRKRVFSNLTHLPLSSKIIASLFKEREFENEATLATFQDQARPQDRFPRPYGHSRRPPDSRPSASEGPRPPYPGLSDRTRTGGAWRCPFPKQVANASQDRSVSYARIIAAPSTRGSHSPRVTLFYGWCRLLPAISARSGPSFQRRRFPWRCSAIGQGA